MSRTTNSRALRPVMLLLWGLVLTVSGSLCAQGGAGIETLMTPQELEATGLGGLTAEELDALNGWLVEKGILPGTSSAPSAPDRAIQAQPAPAIVQNPEPAPTPNAAPPAPRYGEREEIADVVSVIRGEFAGWDGDTVFTLENGQVYRQRRPGRWKVSLTDPEVRVRKSFLGYELEVAGRSIGVRRLR